MNVKCKHWMPYGFLILRRESALWVPLKGNLILCYKPFMRHLIDDMPELWPEYLEISKKTFKLSHSYRENVDPIEHKEKYGEIKKNFVVKSVYPCKRILNQLNWILIGCWSVCVYTRVLFPSHPLKTKSKQSHCQPQLCNFHVFIFDMNTMMSILTNSDNRVQELKSDNDIFSSITRGCYGANDSFIITAQKINHNRHFSAFGFWLFQFSTS